MSVDNGVNIYPYDTTPDDDGYHSFGLSPYWGGWTFNEADIGNWSKDLDGTYGIVPHNASAELTSGINNNPRYNLSLNT
jgi:hypothetical protein